MDGCKRRHGSGAKTAGSLLHLAESHEWHMFVLIKNGKKRGSHTLVQRWVLGNTDGESQSVRYIGLDLRQERMAGALAADSELAATDEARRARRAL